MKFYTLSILLLSALSAFAETPKQMAYGHVNFGDSLEVATAALRKDTEDQNRRHAPADAREAVRDFVIKGTKYPAHLAAKYARTMAGVQLSDFPVRTVKVVTNNTPATEYDTTVKQDWEVLQDIACSKFGAQKTNLGFPPKPADGKTATTVTDTWEYSNLTISLSVRGIKHGDGQLSYSVVLSAALKDGQ